MCKLDINKELEYLVEKYNVDKHYPAYRTSRQACEFLREWVRQFAKTKKRILFLGMDEYALKLLVGWARTENVDMLLIEEVGELEKGTKGYFERLECAEEIYVACYTRTIEILHWLWRHDFQAESIYDILENENIYLQMEFYRFFTPLKISQELELYEKSEMRSSDGSSLVLYEYYYQKQRLLHCASKEDKKRITEKLFFLAICMRNFLEVQRIEATVETIEFKQCFNEIQRLFDIIKKELALKKHNNIIIYWLDALPYEEAEEFAFLQSQRNHSLYFKNAYTVTPYTNPVCKSMFCGICQVDDLGYQESHINLNNSPLLEDIVNQGYQFSIVSDYLSRMFAPQFNHGVELTKCTSCSEVFWNLMSQILQSEQKTVYLVHALMELHPPMLGVQRTHFESQYMHEARKMQMEELDTQLCFYDGLLGDKSYRIYMSDHGDGSDVVKKVHVLFQVYHASWERRETKKMFSFLKFGEIMHQLLIKEEICVDNWDDEHILIQDVDYYNRDGLKDLLKRNWGLGLCFLTAYKGVITKDGIYVRYKTNDEMFYRWSEMESWTKEPIFLSEAEKRLEYFQGLRKQAGDFPAELDSDSKFEYAKYTYKAYENIKSTIRAAAKLLNRKVAAYADGGIALRMGGEHSRQLYELLTETNKKKIGGIIDKSEKCGCVVLGVPIFAPGEQLPDRIQAILLSSKIFLEDLKKEAKNLYADLEAVDIYEYWEQAGYPFQREFYFGLDEDYEVGFPED